MPGTSARGSDGPSTWMLHTCTLLIVTNVCLPPSKFFLDKFSGYNQQEATNVAAAVYICGLVFTTVAGCLIVRTAMCTPWPVTATGRASL